MEKHAIEEYKSFVGRMERKLTEINDSLLALYVGRAVNLVNLERKEEAYNRL